MGRDEVTDRASWEAYCDEHGHPPTWRPHHRHGPDPTGPNTGYTVPVHSGSHGFGG